MPWEEYDKDRVFWTTSIVPMGGHIVIERLQCGSDTRVRVVVNGRVHEVPGCTSSNSKNPRDHGICALDEFERVVRSRWDKGFCATCAPNRPECIDKISFFES